jgi:hypothetical protein
VYVFPKVYPRYPITPESVETYRNVIVVATREEKRRTNEELADAIKLLTATAKPVIKIKPDDMAWHVDHLYRGPKPEELTSVPVLCDDYAPVDTMYRAVKKDEITRALYLGR